MGGSVMKYIRYTLMSIIVLYILYVILVVPLRADWFRIQSSTPLSNRKHLFVATYMHRGPIDVSIPQSLFQVYLTTLYDLTKTPATIYTKITYDLNSSNSAHHEAEEYAVSKCMFERVSSEPLPQSDPRPRPYERYQGIFLADPCIDYDTQFGMRDE